jgi:NIMA (never in mitosis gene a)-related kinase
MEGFQRVKVIGKGAFGSAILVKRDGNQYVIKEVVLDGLGAREKLEAQNEAKLLRQLEHPYIVRYVDSGVQHGKLWIAMEYCSGGDLDEYLANKRKMSAFCSEQEAMGIFAQISLALSYIHDRHILHRDLKSKNVFLSASVPSGKVPIVKLGDFGIAKVLAHTRDKAKTQIGTPYYLSPEICEDKPYGTKSDVWAMGCILFELLALKVPFTAKDLHGLVRRIMHDPTPALPAQYRGVDGLGKLFEGMMRKDFSKRPTIAEVLAEPCVARAVAILNASSTPSAAHPVASPSAPPPAAVPSPPRPAPAPTPAAPPPSQPAPRQAPSAGRRSEAPSAVRPSVRPSGAPVAPARVVRGGPSSVMASQPQPSQPSRAGLLHNVFVIYLLLKHPFRLVLC